MSKKLNIGILIFDEAEVLDFAGPFEVFAVCSELQNHKLFNVFTVAKKTSSINAVNGLSVNPTYSFANAPQIDILIISGGSGTRKQMTDKETLNWINEIHKETTFTLSICSGARLLGVLNLLNGKPYCTHKGVYEHLKKIVSMEYQSPKKGLFNRRRKFSHQEAYQPQLRKVSDLAEHKKTNLKRKSNEHRQD